MHVTHLNPDADVSVCRAAALILHPAFPSFEYASAPATMESARAKRRLDRIFMFHAIASLITGGLAFILPHHITEAIMGSGHMVHAVIRLYGTVPILVLEQQQCIDSLIMLVVFGCCIP